MAEKRKTNGEDSLPKRQALPDEVTAEISLPADDPRKAGGRIIGKGGETLRRVRLSTGVRNITVDYDQGKCVISGSHQAVETCKAMLMQIISGTDFVAPDSVAAPEDYFPRVPTMPTMPSMPGMPTMSTMPTMPTTPTPNAQGEVIIDLPADSAQKWQGRIIGKGGDTVRMLMNTSGATIRVKEGRVAITGTPGAMQTAHKMVSEILSGDQFYSTEQATQQAAQASMKLSMSGMPSAAPWMMPMGGGMGMGTSGMGMGTGGMGMGFDTAQALCKPEVRAQVLSASHQAAFAAASTIVSQGGDGNLVAQAAAQAASEAATNALLSLLV